MLTVEHVHHVSLEEIYGLPLHRVVGIVHGLYGLDRKLNPSCVFVGELTRGPISFVAFEQR